MSSESQISRQATAFIWILTIALIVTLSLACLDAQHDGVGFLGWASSAVSAWTTTFGNLWSTPTRLYEPVGYATLGLLAILILFLIASRQRSLACLMTFALFPCVGEFLVLFNRVTLGVGFHITGFILLICFFLRSSPLPDADQKTTARIKWFECASFLVVFGMTAFYRYYLLNLIPSSWDTELCDYRYTALSSLRNLLLVESTVPRPTSNGFAWTLTFWLLGNVDEPDNYYLYIRLVAAAVSLIKTAALYVCIRYISGPLPALFGVMTLAFAPPENWWARQPNLHHLPGLAAIMLLYAASRAYVSRSWRDFLFLSVMSTLPRIMYASGLFLAFAPLSFFALILVTRWAEWKRHWLKIASLIIPLAIWLAWTSIAGFLTTGTLTVIPPLSLPSGDATPGGSVGLISKIITKTLPDLLSTIFAHQVNPTHWTVALTTAPARSTTSAVIILGILGLARAVAGRGGPISLLLVISIVWASVPGLATEMADRRVGACFVILIIFAAHELGLLLRTFSVHGLRRLANGYAILLVAVTGPYLAWIAMGLHFMDTPRLPIQVIQGRMIRERLRPDTLAIYLTGGMYCDTFMTVWRSLKDSMCSIGWTQPREEPNALDKMIANPHLDLAWLRERDPQLSLMCERASKKWKEVRFLFNSRGGWSEVKARLESLYPNGRFESFDPPANSYSDYKLFSYTVPTERTGEAASPSEEPPPAVS